MDTMPHDCEVDGHEWEFQDDSFDHEFGTEVIRYYACIHCDATREPNDGDFINSYED